MNKGNVIKKFLVFFIVSALFLTGCSKPQKDSIVIGLSRSLTGPLAVFEQTAYGPIYKMWVDDMNAEGGIYVKEYDKKIPIKLIVYDDESDTAKMAANIKKLVEVDKVDLILPPAGTDMIFAAAPLMNEYKFIMIGAEGGAKKLKDMTRDLPYFFSVLNFADHFQVPELVKILVEKGVKTVGMVALSDLHGVEYSTVAREELGKAGINIVLARTIDVGIKDMSLIIKEAKTANVDAFLCFTYPDEGILAVSQAIQNDFNPKVFLIGPGGNFAFFKDIFGPAVNGIMSWGAWNAKVSSAHKAFAEKLVKLYGEGIMDWWGHNLYYASLQCLQKAIEKAGTLDQKKIRDILAAEKFETILGTTWFEGSWLSQESYTGQVGQWQDGIFEVIAPSNKATSNVLYPKPVWPKAVE